MKILAQSIVVPKTAYIHLAYLAATSFTPQKSTMTTGLILIVLGVLLCFRLVVKKAKTLNTKIVDQKMAPVKWCIAGGVISAFGIVALIISYTNGIERYEHPHSVTRGHMRGLVSDYYRAYCYEPKNKTFITFNEYLEDQKKSTKPYIRKRFTDGWGNRFKITVIKDGLDFVIRIDSAGPDKHWGTFDDEIKEFSVDKKKREISTRYIPSPDIWLKEEEGKI